MTETATTEAPKAKATRMKKGEGPVVLSFLDAAGKEFPRVSETTVALSVKDKVGGSLVVNIADFSPAIITQLALNALKARVDSPVRATVDDSGNNEQGENIVLKTAKEVIDRVKTGQIYARGLGTGEKKAGTGQRGRPFDVDLWVAVVREGSKIKVDRGLKKKDGTPWAVASDEALERYKAKLLAATPAERNKMKVDILSDKTLAFAHAKIMAQRAAEAAKKEGGEGEDGFEI